MKNDWQVGELGRLLHQLDAVLAGQDQVEQHQSRLLAPDDLRDLPRLAGHQRGVAGPGQPVAHRAQHVRVVVDHEDARRLARLPTRRRLRDRFGAGLPGHRQGEGDGGAAPGAGALGPDAPAVRLHQSLADREPQPVAGLRSPPGVLVEEPRQPFGRHPAALVGDRDRDVGVLARRRDPDGRGFRRGPRGVGEEVVEHLHDAPAVGHRSRQAGGEVDEDGVPPAAAGEGVPRPLHQFGDVGGLGRDRERARVDAARVQQVTDQAPHVARLLRR